MRNPVKWVYMVVLVLMALFAHSVGGFGPFFMFALAFSVYLGSAAWLLLASKGIALAFDLRNSHRVIAGDMYPFALAVRNISGVTWPWVSASLELPNDVEQNRPVCHCGVVPHGQRRSFEMLLCFTRRGYYHKAALKLTMRDLLGLFDQTWIALHHLDLIVLPTILDLTGRAHSSGQPVGLGDQDRWLSEDMGELIGVRPYYPGDHIHRIHWKTTAKTGAMMVRTFAHQSESQVYLYLDCCSKRQTGEGSASSFERAVVATASLAHHFLQQGIATGLLAGGAPVPFQPARSHPDQINQVLDNLALVQPGTTDETVADVQARLEPINPGSLVIIISSMGDQALIDVRDHLKIRRLRPLTIQIDWLSHGSIPSSDVTSYEAAAQEGWITVRAQDDLSAALGRVANAI